MARFRTRRFQPRDEAALNDAFLQVERTKWRHSERSLELMRWLWYQSPGGAIESWLVEAEQADGSWQIVGHHGLCPVRFTQGDQQLLCAKTVNSFLLPQYRSRFLYLRFEKQCLEEALPHYHMIYSYAQRILRLRGSLGHRLQDTSIVLEHGSQHPDLASRLLAHLVHRFPHTPWKQITGLWANYWRRTARKPPFEWTEYTAAEAMGSPFFAGFWDQARAEAGMSPRRDVADLAWRFWSRPGSQFQTLVHSWPGGARSYCIVDTSNPFLYDLSDFFVTPMCTDLLEDMLDALFAWCAQRRALIVIFSTTSHGHPEKLMELLLRRMRPHPLSAFRQPEQLTYFLSPKGKSAITMPISSWNATKLLFPC